MHLSQKISADGSLWPDVGHTLVESMFSCSCPDIANPVSATTTAGQTLRYRRRLNSQSPNLTDAMCLHLLFYSYPATYLVHPQSKRGRPLQYVACPVPNELALVKLLPSYGSSIAYLMWPSTVGWFNEAVLNMNGWVQETTRSGFFGLLTIVKVITMPKVMLAML